MTKSEIIGQYIVITIIALLGMFISYAGVNTLYIWNEIAWEVKTYGIITTVVGTVTFGAMVRFLFLSPEQTKKDLDGS